MQDMIDWFLTIQRDFPWRKERTPYRVWVSEVMLQQTRASVVIPYFEKWMEKFPTLKSLANAELLEVLKIWEGLGYYSRARNLHAGAKEVEEKFGGVLPDSLEKLLSIKGIGPYTAGAIIAFAFEKKGLAIDANVFRVLSRFFVTEEKKVLEKGLLELLPDKKPHLVMEGLIELGALICTKNPRCEGCPLQKKCRAFLERKADLFPSKKKRAETIILHRFIGCIECEGSILLRTVEKGKVMADLYEFPYVEKKGKSQINFCKKKLERVLQCSLKTIGPMDRQVHTFTKYKVYLYPYYFSASKKSNLEGYQWVSLEELQKFPYPSGHREILLELLGRRKIEL